MGGLIVVLISLSKYIEQKVTYFHKSTFNY